MRPALVATLVAGEHVDSQVERLVRCGPFILGQLGVGLRLGLDDSLDSNGANDAKSLKGNKTNDCSTVNNKL